MMWPAIGALAAAAIFAIAGFVNLRFAPEIKRFREERSLFEFNRTVAKVSPLSTYRLGGWVLLGCSLVFLIGAIMLAL
jgi:hypothetical protein